MSISLVMIVKNEERDLARCLNSVKDHVEEMIIVDTGSTDRTKEIAASYSHKRPLKVTVLDFQWCNDFSAARNFGLDAATGDWILVLDADEEIATGHKHLKGLTGDSEKDLYLVNLEIGSDPADASTGKYQSTLLPRLFRNAKSIRFHNPVHESLASIESSKTGICPEVTILHFGPALDTPDEVDERHARNLHLLKEAIKAEPRNGFLFYMLSGEQVHRGDYELACRSLNKAIKLEKDTTKRYVASSYRNLALCYMNIHKPTLALKALQTARLLYPKYTDLLFVEAQIRESIGEEKAAVTLYKHCLNLGDPSAPFETWGGTGSDLALEKLNLLQQKIGPTISLVMIVKNEERYLARCLNSVKDHVDEMIIVDTGSTDRTKEIAASFGGAAGKARQAATTGYGRPIKVTVLDYEWNDDFAAARNVGLEAASGDWILHLDADEELAAGGDLFPELTSNPEWDLYYFKCAYGPDPKLGAEGAYPGTSVPRLFRNKPVIRYRSVIHEIPVIPDEGRSCFCPFVTILHFGPSQDGEAEIRERQERNTRILKKALQKSPDDPYLIAKLAGEHFMTGEFSQALTEYQRSLTFASADAQFAPTAMRNMAICYLQAGRLELATATLERAKIKFPKYADLHFLEGEIHESQGRTRDAIEVFTRCLGIGDPPPGYDSWGGTGSWRAAEKLRDLEQQS